MNMPLAVRALTPALIRQAGLIAALRIVALAVAAILAGCSTSAPKPPRCDGSDRRAVNAPTPSVAALLPSKSCSEPSSSPLGSRDSG